MYEDYLMHHGILGQKWGIRRYQNRDGTLTEAGRQRYGNHIQDYPERKLRRQVYATSMKSVGGKPGAYEKTMESYRQYSKKHSPYNNLEAVNDFLNKMAAAKLSDMGYAQTDEAVAYLRSRPWFNMPYDWLVDRSKPGVTTFQTFYPLY